MRSSLGPDKLLTHNSCGPTQVRRPPTQFPSLQVASRNFFRISEPSSVFLSAFAGSTLNYGTGLPQFSLGGSQELVAYGTNELLMNQYFLFQLGYIRQLAKLPPLLGSGIYFLGLYEAAQVYDQPPLVNQGIWIPDRRSGGHSGQYHLRPRRSSLRLRRYRAPQVLFQDRTSILSIRRGRARSIEAGWLPAPPARASPKADAPVVYLFAKKRFRAKMQPQLKSRLIQSTLGAPHDPLDS